MIFLLRVTNVSKTKMDLSSFQINEKTSLCNLYCMVFLRIFVHVYLLPFLSS